MDGPEEQEVTAAAAVAEVARAEEVTGEATLAAAVRAAVGGMVVASSAAETVEAAAEAAATAEAVREAVDPMVEEPRAVEMVAPAEAACTAPSPR